MALKWGIVSTGNIASDFTAALSTLSKDDHQVIAVAASSDISRSQDFAKRFGIPKAYGTYLELAKDPEIEVVHIGMLHIHHTEVALMMLDHGKHVLVEIPMGMNEKQVRQLTAHAKSKNLFAMEGVWSRTLPSYQYIREQINSGRLGEIISVDVEVGFPGLDEIPRLKEKDLGGGPTLEFAAFLLQFCQLIFRKEPKLVKASGKLNDEGVDKEMTAELSYGNNKVAKIKTSAMEMLSNSAKVVGANGTMTVPWFYAATSVDIDGNEKTFESFPEVKDGTNFPRGTGMRYEAEEVRKCIRAGKIESELLPHSESILIARIQEQIRKEIGVKYAADD